MNRFIQSAHGSIPIPSAWRGNCECGKWLVVLRAFTKDKTLDCECGRCWYVEGDEAVFFQPKPKVYRVLLRTHISGSFLGTGYTSHDDLGTYDSKAKAIARMKKWMADLLAQDSDWFFEPEDFGEHGKGYVVGHRLGTASVAPSWISYIESEVQ